MQECILKLYDLQKKNELEKAITGVKNKKGEMIYPRLKIIIKNHLINYIKTLMRDICIKAESLDELIENNKLIENISIETPKKRDAQELIFLNLIYNKGIKWLNGIPRLYNETFEPIVIDSIEFLRIVKKALGLSRNEISRFLKSIGILNIINSTKEKEERKKKKKNRRKIGLLNLFDKKVLLCALFDSPIRKIMAADLKTNTNKIRRAESKIWYVLNKLIIESEYKDNPKERDYSLRELEYVNKAFKTGENQAYWTGR